MSLETTTPVISLERYRILSELGRGAMGVVYLAFDMMLQEEVALKVLHESLTKDEQSQKRFLREISLTRKVTHANVVRTFDAGIQGDMIYVSMEYIKGQPLKELLVHTPPSTNEALRIFEEITWGLQAIHKAEIIHRDLKLSNLLLDAEGTVKIADFGIARPKSSDLTTDDEMLGTATHMAPEIWKSDTITKQTDLYALGVIAYELFTHILPFPSASPMELMYHHIHTKPVDPRKVNDVIPEKLSKLILQLLEKQPADRPGSAVDVLYQIDEIRNGSVIDDDYSNIVNMSGASTLLEPIGLNPTITQKTASVLAPAEISSWKKVEPVKATEPKRKKVIPPVVHTALFRFGMLFSAVSIVALLFASSSALFQSLTKSSGLYGVYLWGALTIGSVSVAMALPWFLSALFRSHSMLKVFGAWINGAALISLFGGSRLAYHLSSHLEETVSHTGILSIACSKALAFTASLISVVPFRLDPFSINSFNAQFGSWNKSLPLIFFASVLILWSKIFSEKFHFGRILTLIAIGFLQYLLISQELALSLGKLEIVINKIELEIPYIALASGIVWMIMLQVLCTKKVAK